MAWGAAMILFFSAECSGSSRLARTAPTPRAWACSRKSEASGFGMRVVTGVCYAAGQASKDSERYNGCDEEDSQDKQGKHVEKGHSILPLQRLANIHQG